MSTRGAFGSVRRVVIVSPEASPTLASERPEPPKASAFCRNPSCDGTEFEEVPLSNRGTVWSFTTNHYAPPPPYLAADPFEPFSVAAVQLPEEKMVVLGQVADGVDPATVRIGDKVELVLGTLFEDDDREYVVWKWKPIEGARSDG